jgi:hypothetical protein
MIQFLNRSPRNHTFQRAVRLEPSQLSFGGPVIEVGKQGAHRQRPTAWLGMQDSNSEMSWQIIALKGRADFGPNSGLRDHSRLSCGVGDTQLGLDRMSLVHNIIHADDADDAFPLFIPVRVCRPPAIPSRGERVWNLWHANFDAQTEHTLIPAVGDALGMKFSGTAQRNQ